jgi:hypothetical protein
MELMVELVAAIRVLGVVELAEVVYLLLTQEHFQIQEP